MVQGHIKIYQILESKNRKEIQKLISVESKDKKEVILSDKGIDLVKYGAYLYYVNSSVFNEQEFSVFFCNDKYFQKIQSITQELIYFFNGLTDRFKLKIMPIKYNSEIIENNQKYDKVILFSGGLDSLTQTVRSIENREKILLCYTNHNKKVTRNVRNLVSELEKMFKIRLDLVEINYFGIKCKQEKEQGIINSRAVAYALNGIAIADSVNAKEVIIPENGAIATLPKFDISIEPTRTVSPYLMEKIANIAFDLTGIKLSDSLAKETKADVVKTLKDRKKLIHLSYSCTHPNRRDKLKKNNLRDIGHYHCGTCLACFIRMTALLAVGIDENKALYKQMPMDFQTMSEISKYKYKNDFYTLISLLDYCYDILERTKINELNHFIRSTIELNQNSHFSEFEDLDILSLQKSFALDILIGINEYYRKNNLPMQNFVLGKSIKSLLAKFKVRLNNRMKELE